MPIFRRPLYFANVKILGPDGIIGRSLRVQGRRVAALDEPPRRRDCLIDGRGGLLIPGLINAHDHLELNTFARLKYRERYSHAVQWIEDIEARFETDPRLVDPRRQSLAGRLLVGALKNLLSGVTTVCHHNPLHRPLRWGYPVRIVRNYAFCHSLFRGDEVRRSYRQANPAWPWIIHLAEGVDATAQAEFEQLVALGALKPNTLLVHGVGLAASQRRRLIAHGGGLIWCPGSNRFMFGQTATVGELAAAGKLALGSDSRLSGELDLLAELRVANEFGQLTPAHLFQAVTANPRRMLRLTKPGLGEIVPGGVADLVLLPSPAGSDPFAALLDLDRSQVQLVMLGGRPLVAAPWLRPVFEATRTGAAAVQVDGVGKLMVSHLVRRYQQSSVAEPGLVVSSTTDDEPVPY